MMSDKSLTKLSVSKIDENAKKALKALLKQGVPLGLTCGLDKEHLDVLYINAYNLYSEKKYQEALKVFEGMLLYNHFDKRGWIGCGACFQVLHNYANAVTCYSNASLIDIQDPLPIFYSIECYIYLKNYSQARSALKVVQPLIKDKAEYAHFKNELIKIEEFLQQNK